MSFVAALNRKALDLAKLAVEMTTAAASGHPSSGLALAHLIAALMYHHIRWNPQNPWNPASDRLVLSEGHAVPIVYAAYADLGGLIGKSPRQARPMTRDDALQLRDIASPIDGLDYANVGLKTIPAAV